MDGDTVVVYPGLYDENILIDKTITLTSLALFDTTTNTILESLDSWYDWISDQYMVIDENINSTIIDGSGETKSTITIATEEDLCIEPIILGFTIQDGSGTLVDRFYENGSVTIQQYMGGGILSYLANPILHYNKIQNNGGLEDVIKSGSAIYPASSSDDIDFIDRNTERNRDCGNDVFDFTHNFFENNFSSLGRHIGNRYFEGDIDLSNCVFDYWNCQDEGVYQTPIWVNIDDINDLVVEDEENSGCLLTGDFYVDPVDGNDDLNDGLSWESPFYTITNTLHKVVGTENAPVNIYLGEGTYSPNTNGESFPIIMISYVNLIGQGEEVTIIDAEQSGSVIAMEDCENNTISGFTLTGGAGVFSNGVILLYSSPTMNRVNISGNVNSEMEMGSGGMYLHFSNPIMKHVTINDNRGAWGGGMQLSSSNPILINVTISNNTSLSLGPALYLSYSDPILINSIIWHNSPYNPNSDAIIYGSGDPFISYSNIEGEINYWEGEGNIISDPLFVDLENGDFTLEEYSPCIDIGTPYFAYEGEILLDLDPSEYVGSSPDMGAYEYGDCSVSLGDVNGNGQINILDIIQIINLIFQTDAPLYECAADYNDDEMINLLDIIAIVNYMLNFDSLNNNFIKDK